MGVNIEVSFDQLLRILLQLPPEEKLLMAERLKAAAAAEKWEILSKKLPDATQVSMEELVAEIKTVRKKRQQTAP